MQAYVLFVVSIQRFEDRYMGAADTCQVININVIQRLQKVLILKSGIKGTALSIKRLFSPENVPHVQPQ